MRDYPGIEYFEPPLETIPGSKRSATPSDPGTETRPESNRHRKRKTVDSNPNPPSDNAGTKSPHEEALSMDNGQGYADSDLVVDDITSVRSSGSSPDKCDKVTRPWTRSPAAPSAYDPNCAVKGPMSVRDLEDVMNRHLPQHNGSPVDGSPDVLMLKSFPPTSGSPTQQQQQQRPIQWIGGPPASLPATTLLRQIYVSRESVIRSAGTRHGCYPDGTLPTPPGGPDPPYGDLMLQQSSGKLPDSSPGGYGSTSSYLDNCNAMTPPSSVSPRDNFNEAAAVAAAAAMPHMRHYVTDPNSLQHLPLKPHQLFVHPGNLDHPGSYVHPQQTLSSDQHQSLYHHPSSFHLYHPPPGGSKTTLHATNGASWFCQPHS